MQFRRVGEFRRTFGASRFRRTFGATPATTFRTLATGRPVTTTGTTWSATAASRVASGLLSRPLGAGAGDVALVDPNLDPDPTEGRLGLVEAVVDVGPEGVQRHLTLAVELRTAHLGTAQTTGALDPDPLRAGAHRTLLRLTHGPPKLHPGRELLRHALSHQLGVGFGVLDLEDVQLDLLARELLQVAANTLGLGAIATDDDARARCEDVHPHPVTSALDLHRGDPGSLQALGQQPADLDVLADVVGVELVCVPATLVVSGDAKAETVRIDLLTHAHFSFERVVACPRFACSVLGSTTTVM